MEHMNAARTSKRLLIHSFMVIIQSCHQVPNHQRCLQRPCSRLRFCQTTMSSRPVIVLLIYKHSKAKVLLRQMITLHSVSLNNPSPAPESTESIAQTADECSYDSQTPKPVMVYSCGATSDPQLATVAVDILYEYDLFISRKINANDAVQEIKNKIMLDLGTF